MNLAQVVGVIGGIAVFLYGMRIMSEGLQKVAGSRMRALLSKVTDNRFGGVAPPAPPPPPPAAGGWPRASPSRR